MELKIEQVVAVVVPQQVEVVLQVQVVREAQVVQAQQQVLMDHQQLLLAVEVVEHNVELKDLVVPVVEAQVVKEKLLQQMQQQ